MRRPQQPMLFQGGSRKGNNEVESDVQRAGRRTNLIPSGEVWTQPGTQGEWACRSHEKTCYHLHECYGRFRLAELFIDLPQQFMSRGVSYRVMWPFWPEVLVQPTAPISTSLTLVVPDPRASLLSSILLFWSPINRCFHHDPWNMAPQRNLMATWQHHPLGFQGSFSLQSVFHKEDP